MPPGRSSEPRRAPAALRRLHDSQARRGPRADPRPCGDGSLPAVRAVACARSAAGGSGATALLSRPRRSDPEVRRGALMGLLESAQRPPRARVSALASSPAPSDRAGRRGSRASRPRARGSPLGLPRRPRPLVRRAAGPRRRARERELWPSVVDALGDHRLRGAAMAALALGGSDVTEVLAPCLQGAAASPVARAAASVLGRVRGPHAQEALRAHLAYPDPIVRLEVLESLRLSGYAPPADGEEATAVRRQLEEELDDAAWTIAVLRDLPPEPVFAVLRAALARELASPQQSSSSLVLPIRRHPARARGPLTDRARSAPTRWRCSTHLGPDLSPLARAAGGADAVFAARSARPLPTVRLGGEPVKKGAPPRASVSPGRRVLGRPRPLFGAAWASCCPLEGGERALRDTAAGGGRNERRARVRRGRRIAIEMVICLKAVPISPESPRKPWPTCRASGRVEYAKGQVVFEKGLKATASTIVSRESASHARARSWLGPQESSRAGLAGPEPRLPPRRREYTGCSGWTAIRSRSSAVTSRSCADAALLAASGEGGYAGDRVALTVVGVAARNSSISPHHPEDR